MFVKLLNLVETTLFGNSIQAYLSALGIFLVSIIVAKIMRRAILRRAKRWATRTSNTLDDQVLRLLEKPLTYLFYIAGFYLSTQSLTLVPRVQEGIHILCIIASTLWVVQISTYLIGYSIRLYCFKRYKHTATQASLDAMIPAIKVFVWAVGAIFLLDNLGFDISAVIASLGIGGIAVALAAQGILGDLFSYFSILLDRPFEIGDFVIIGELQGTVEHIGIKTTRLRSLGGEEWIVSNTDLTASRVQNYKRMNRRRIVFTVGVTYETGQANLKAIPDLIKQAIESTSGVSFDRAHFLAFSDFSLDFEVVYFVESKEYADYMDAQQTINLLINQAFNQAGIEFAYPTHKLYVEQEHQASLLPANS